MTKAKKVRIVRLRFVTMASVSLVLLKATKSVFIIDTSKLKLQIVSAPSFRPS